MNHHFHNHYVAPYHNINTLMALNYESMTTAQPSMICRFKPDTTLVFVNEAYCKAFNRTKEELIGKKFLELIPTSEHQQIKDWLKDFSNDREIKDYEHQVTLPDGQTGWQVWTDTAFFDKNGNVVEFQSVGRDITLQKQAELVLNQTLGRLRALLDYSPVPLTIFDDKGTYFDVSDATARALGTTPDELTGRTFYDIYPKETADGKIRILRELHRNKKPIVIIGQNETNGQLRTYETRLFPVEYPGEERSLFAAISIDITDRVLAEDRIKAEQQRLENIIIGTRAGTWERNYLTGEIKYNQQYAAILGYQVEELADWTMATWLKHLHPDDLAVTEKAFEAYTSGKSKYYECKLRIKHKKGHWVWVMDRGKMTAFTEEGKPLVMQGTHLDISHIKRAEDELRRANLEIKAAAEQAEKLAAQAGAASRAKSETILVAEDLAINRELTRAILLELMPNARMVEAGNGEETLVAIRKHSPDLVIMDVQMPRLDGLETTRLLRQEEKLSHEHTPVVALTAGVLPEEKAQCYEAGMDDFLTKPLNYEKLKLTLAKHLVNNHNLSEPSDPSSHHQEEVHQATVLNLFQKVMNDASLFLTISLQFEKDSLFLLALMEEAIEKQDSEMLVGVAHGMKGILNALEATEAYVTASRLEGMGAQSDFEGAEITCHQLKEMVNDMILAFQHKRDQLQQNTDQ